jgi:hypothetical protein
MNTLKASILLFGAALLFSSSALAGNANKGTLDLAEKVSVDGKPLNPGTYKVEWEGAGPTVQVTLLQGREKVATFPAHLTEQANSNSANAYGSDIAPDGSRTLKAIYIGGKRDVLEIQPAGAPQQAATQGSN